MGLYPEWMADGACAEVGGDVHFPEPGEPTKPAKTVCARCGVREICLQYALDNGERHGVWGGLSERERRRLQRGEPLAAALDREAPTVVAHGAQIRALAEQGLDDIQIGKACGLDQRKVWRIRERAGIAHGRHHRGAAA